MTAEKSSLSPASDLIAALSADDPILQADAARLLGELRLKQAVAPLVRYVTDDRHYTKAAGLHALANIGDRSAVSAVRPLVEKPNCPDDWYWFAHRSVQTAAALALLALGDDSGVAFLLKLADAGDDVFYCWYGAPLLQVATPSAALDKLKSKLTSAAVCEGKGRRFVEPGVTVMAARALGAIADPLACDKLQELMKHHSRYVRGQAAMSLLAAAATPKHLHTVQDLQQKDPTAFVKIKSTLALLKAGHGETGDIASFARDAEDAFDRAVAVEALGLAGDAKHRNVVANNLSHENAYVRRCAVEALDRFATQPSAVDSSDVIRPLLNDPDPLVRLQSAKFFAARQSPAEANP